MSWNSQAISPSDLDEAWRIFDGRGIPRAQIRFAYMAETDCWCLRNADGDGVIATRDANDVQWREG